MRDKERENGATAYEPSNTIDNQEDFEDDEYSDEDDEDGGDINQRILELKRLNQQRAMEGGEEHPEEED